ncbi:MULTISPECIES: RNA polymerase sigma factor [unclassified Cupriavidus]|uniref:RNA polymerase sigma factor n=1 Tax=unclassified Cupriavidus TaxID=2640874 RepID=UPI00313ADA54
MNIRDVLIDHVPRLRRYARALIQNRELADDLVQDTLERALGHAHQYRPDGDARAWLFAIMHNVHANQARRASARAPHVAMEGDVLDAAIDAAGFAGLAGTPDGQARALELRDLDAALAKLSAEQREVVLLVGLEDMSYAEVAQTLGIPLGTVMSRLSRGRERLRALMAGEAGDLGQGAATKLRVVR